MMPRIPWTRIVELAEYIRDEHRRGVALDADTVLRLVQAVLQFQEQLLGGLVRPFRG